jgi:hypothetical protein
MRIVACAFLGLASCGIPFMIAEMITNLCWIRAILASMLSSSLSTLQPLPSDGNKLLLAIVAY